jgi:hypothetical protein
MKKRIVLTCLAHFFALLAFANEAITIESPDKNLVCRVLLNNTDGKASNLFYELDYKNKSVIKRST